MAKRKNVLKDPKVDKENKEVVNNGKENLGANSIDPNKKKDVVVEKDITKTTETTAPLAEAEKVETVDKTAKEKANADKIKKDADEVDALESETEEEGCKTVKEKATIAKPKKNIRKNPIFKIFASLFGVGILLWMTIAGAVSLAEAMGLTNGQEPQSYTVAITPLPEFTETTDDRPQFTANEDVSRFFEDDRYNQCSETVRKALSLVGEPQLYHKSTNISDCLDKGGDTTWCFRGEPYREGSVGEWDVTMHWFSPNESINDVIITLNNLNDNVTYKIDIKDSGLAFKSSSEDAYMMNFSKDEDGITMTSSNISKLRAGWMPNDNTGALDALDEVCNLKTQIAENPDLDVR